MSLENMPFREKYAETEKDVSINQYDLEHQKERRSKRIAEFKEDITRDPISALGAILTIVDLLPTNLDVLLSKRRLHSSQKKVESLKNQNYDEALALDQQYEELKTAVVKAEGDFRDSLNKLAEFQKNELGMTETQ
ncbi:MAG: hypothetical protein V1711_02555 [bacterium]